MDSQQSENKILKDEPSDDKQPTTSKPMLLFGPQALNFMLHNHNPIKFLDPTDIYSADDVRQAFKATTAAEIHQPKEKNLPSKPEADNQRPVQRESDLTLLSKQAFKAATVAEIHHPKEKNPPSKPDADNQPHVEQESDLIILSKQAFKATTVAEIHHPKEENPPSKREADNQPHVEQESDLAPSGEPALDPHKEKDQPATNTREQEETILDPIDINSADDVRQAFKASNAVETQQPQEENPPPKPKADDQPPVLQEPDLPHSGEPSPDARKAQPATNTRAQEKTSDSQRECKNASGDQPRSNDSGSRTSEVSGLSRKRGGRPPKSGPSKKRRRSTSDVPDYYTGKLSNYVNFKRHSDSDSDLESCIYFDQ